MESEESPLDVLSRAATMVSPPAYDEARSYTTKEMPSAKWRRERRQIINSKIMDGPLDFSTRSGHSPSEKPPPPSYAQSMQKKKLTRPSVIQTAGAVNLSVATTPTTTTHSDDACDPAIDEHFRRSLGKDYSSIFSKDKTESNKADSQDSDLTGLSVDDHFAKALGDTWLKLKEQENEEKLAKNNNNNNHMGKSGKGMVNGGTAGGVSPRKKKTTTTTTKDPVLNDKRRAVVATST